ncbi:hypothetical protein OAN307_c37430 [Octadecabacter antarcticus 307]|uniref:Uncharacterized protein n=1 Tax=Octadecabacter antarcticus 307 TaxID=391626 RepID=M9RH86_9RHOB|nr:hypothetical protein OAN307_c37430 [Octadecabacter antarcticus 307]
MERTQALLSNVQACVVGQRVARNIGCGARYIFLARQGIDEETLEIRAVHCRQAIAKQSAKMDVTSMNFVPVPGHWGTLPLSVKGAPDGTTAAEVHRRL